MSDFDRFSAVKISKTGHVLRCALNRPEHNSMSTQLHHELEDLFQLIPNMDDVRVVVLAAEGRYFSAGGDINVLIDAAEASPVRPDAVGEFRRNGSMRIIRNLLQIPQPVVAAVQGDAVGIGATLALLSDVVVMRHGARIGDTHVRVGLAAGDGGSVIWPMLVGVNRAKELLMTGRLLDAEEALALGAANHAFPPADFDAGLAGIVDQFTKLPPFAVQATKSMVNRDLLARIEQNLDYALVIEAITARTDDHKAALQAFMNKTRPTFTGR